MFDPFFWLFVGLVLFLVVMLQVWFYRRALQQVEHWAQANGYQLVNTQLRLFRLGPYMWLSSRAQMVFRFQVLDNDGQKHSGFVRVGGFFTGALSHQVDVIWDKQPAQGSDR
jgi:hypothetical protein